MVNISAIRIEGFRSYVNPIDFKFGDKGLYQVSGPNGVGKTTLFSALVWALYGQNLHETDNKAVQTYKWMQGKEYKGTRVMLRMQIAGTVYMIARHLNYSGATFGLKGESKLMIFSKPVTDKGKFTSEHMVNDALYKKDQQQYINGIIGLSAKAFINSLVFGQGLARLIKASGVEKRELFEEFFDLGWVEDAKAKADLEKVDLNNQITALSTEDYKLQVQIDSATAQRNQAKAYLDNFNAAKEERINDIKSEGRELKQRYEDLKAQRDAMVAANKKKAGNTTAADVKSALNAATAAQEAQDALKRDIRVQKSNLDDIDRKTAGIARKIEELSGQATNIATECPTCGAPVKPDKIKTLKKNLSDQMKEQELERARLNSFKGDYVTALERLDKELQEAGATYDAAYKEYELVKAKFESTVSDDVTSIEARIEETRTALERTKQRLTKAQDEEPVEQDITAFDDTIAQAEAKQRENSVKTKELTNRLDKVTWWITEGFSSKGLKSYIFSAMLAKLNEFAAQYAVYFGYHVKFFIDLDKKSKPFVTTIYKDGHELDYSDLSGGQRQRVDVVLAFAMNDLACYKNPCNLLILDELFESLDQAGIELAYEVIRRKSEQQAVYVVSHSPFVEVNDAVRIEISGGTDGQPSELN
ncbi:MAG: AAA family ATPase [Chitinophagales bacterium]|nr:AAA family ATPase [Chitinophagales bacterium]